MRVTKFEDLIAWQKAQDLAVLVYNKFGSQNDFGFKNQICRAVVSVSNNIAEGFERKSDKEFMNFLNIAKGSAGEVRAQLYLALDFGYISDDFHKNLANEFRSISSHIAGLIRYVQNKPQK